MARRGYLNAPQAAPEQRQQEQSEEEKEAASKAGLLKWKVMFNDLLMALFGGVALCCGYFLLDHHYLLGYPRPLKIADEKARAHTGLQARAGPITTRLGEFKGMSGTGWGAEDHGICNVSFPFDGPNGSGEIEAILERQPKKWLWQTTDWKLEWLSAAGTTKSGVAFRLDLEESGTPKPKAKREKGRRRSATATPPHPSASPLSTATPAAAPATAAAAGPLSAAPVAAPVAAPAPARPT